MEAAPVLPPTSPALREFLERSPCPFAQRARVAPCGPWPDPRPHPDRLAELHACLQALTQQRRDDVLALEIERANLLRTPEEAAALINAVLSGLRDLAPESEPLTTGIESPAWDFRHCDEKFFVSLFAPFYPRSHPRWSWSDSAGYVLFQPEWSFRGYGVSSRRPNREGLSRAVGARFDRHDQGYDAKLNAATPKALRFVKPLGAEERPIAWWRLPYEAAAG